MIPQLGVVQAVASGGLRSLGTPALECTVCLEVVFCQTGLAEVGPAAWGEEVQQPGALTGSAATQ